ncbi:Gem-associated protein 5 [Chamberlinius hualienensis]
MLDSYLPPSQNWYCSRITDFSKNGMLAYGSRNSVVLLKLWPDSLTGDRLKVTYHEVINVNNKKVCGVQFCHLSNNVHLLAFVGEDYLVHVFDINAKSIIFKHDSHKAKITCVTWSSYTGGDSCVVSGDENGKLLVANVLSKKIKEFIPYAASISCVSCCKHAPYLVAIGYSDGNIIVIDLANGGKIIFLLQQHNKEIVSICWAPFIGAGIYEDDVKNVDDHQHTENYLFVSSSRDRNIKIWSVFQRMCVRSMQIPTNVNSSYSRNQGDQEKKLPWFTVQWPEFDHDILLSSSLSGALLSWDLKRNKKSWTVLGKEEHQHSRSIQNIALYENIAVTVSVDRTLRFWSVTESETTCKLSIPTLGGAVYELTFSPFSAGILAVACADATIRVWNIASSDNSFNATLFWPGLKTKVTTLAWHPKKEGCLAFGTESGRVGIYDILTSKPPSFSQWTHTKIVYTVCWGPICPTRGNTDNLGLYSIGGSTVIMHNVPFKRVGVFDLNKLLKVANPNLQNCSKWTEVSWKPDYSLLCLGNNKGDVELYDATDLSLIFILSGLPGGKHCVQSMKWHPLYTYSTNSSSKYQHILAVASRLSVIHVYDLSQYLDENLPTYIKNTNTESAVSLPVKIPEFQFQLGEHVSSVSSLSWSPHCEGQLVTASFDNTCCVWNVFERKLIACYINHTARVLCAEWNPADPNMIFSGGEDFMVHAWKISEQPNKFIRNENVCNKIVEVTATTKELKVAKLEESSNNDGGNVGHEKDSKKLSSVLEEIQKTIEMKRIELQNKSAEKESFLSNVSECPSNGNGKLTNEAFRKTEEKVSVKSDDEVGELPISQDRKLVTGFTNRSGFDKIKKKKKRVEKSLFPLSSRLEAGVKDCILQDSISLIDRLLEIDNENQKFRIGDAVNLSIYGGRTDAFDLLKSEANNHIESGGLEYALQLEIWKGNIKGAVDIAVKHQQLSDSLLALASIPSSQFGSEMCPLYVNQLIAGHQYHKAVLYLLANRKIREAIDVLKTHVSFKEAIILAKIRLMPKDPLISQLVEECAEQWLQRDRSDCAAKWYLSIGKFEMAADVLSRKRDPASVRVAAYIAHKTGSPQSEYYIQRCINDSLVLQNFKMAIDVISQYPLIKPFKPVVEVHKQVTKSSWKCPLSCTSMCEKFLLIAYEAVKNEIESIDNSGDYCSSAQALIGNCQVMKKGAADEAEMELWISLNFILVALDILENDYERAVNRILDMFIEVLNQFNSLYFIPLACTFISMDQLTSLVDSCNLGSLLGLTDAVLPESEVTRWWNSILSFLCLAKLKVMLNFNQFRCNDEKQIGVSEDDTQLIANTLLDENRARLAMSKMKLSYLVIAINVLTKIEENRNESSKALTQELNNVHTSDNSTVVAEAQESTHVKCYDRLLELSSITVNELQEEKSSLEKEINRLSTLVVVDKFPKPFESCVLILELCLLYEGVFWKKLFTKTLEFGRKFVVTQRQSQILDDKNNFFVQK